MVICTYFLTNNCRFGTKCMNDHVDLKQLIVSEIDSARKGKQWLLSCFGPFKEKKCLLDGSYDLSYEELRCDFVEARKMNNFSSYDLQVRMKIKEVDDKLNALKNMTPDVLNAVIQIYNAEEKGQQQAQPAQNSAFGNNNTGSGFAPAANNTASIFGSMQQSQAAIKPVSSIFGGASTNVFSNSSFGTNANTFGTSNTASIFGTAPATNTFGASPPNNNTFGTTNTGSIFGTAPATNTNTFFGGSTGQATNNSIFGAKTETSAFGNSMSTNSIFGNSTTNTGLFGSSFSNPQQQQQQLAPSQFAGPFSSQPVATENQNFFSSAMGTNQQQQQQQPQTQGSIFGTASTGGFFGAPQNQTAPETSIFGQTQPQQQSIFGQTANPGFNQTQGGSLFQQSQQQQQQPVAPSPFGLFQQPAENTQPQQTSIFGNMQTNVTPTQPQQQQQSIFGNPNPPPPPAPIVDDRIYSKMEELTSEEISQFQSEEEFILGKIPTKPPPKELCF